jgi:UrcA family protein
MTTKSILTPPLLALAVAFAAAPSLAADESTVVGERQPTYQERVSYTDLDLRQGSAQSALRIRVRRASERVCIQAEGPLEALQGRLSICNEATYRDARPQITAAIARAKSGQQMAMNLVVSLSARAR